MSVWMHKSIAGCLSAITDSRISVSLARWDNECYSPDEHVKCSTCGRITSVLQALDGASACKDLEGTGWSRIG